MSRKRSTRGPRLSSFLFMLVLVYLMTVTWFVMESSKQEKKPHATSLRMEYLMRKLNDLINNSSELAHSLDRINIGGLTKDKYLKADSAENKKAVHNRNTLLSKQKNDILKRDSDEQKTIDRHENLNEENISTRFIEKDLVIKEPEVIIRQNDEMPDKKHEVARMHKCPEIVTDFQTFDMGDVDIAQLYYKTPKGEKKKLKTNIYAYSAYLDDRELETEGRVHIRIFILQPLNIYKKLAFHCQVNTTNGPLSTPGEFYEMTEHHRKFYASYILNCKFSKQVLDIEPCHVSVISRVKGSSAAKVHITMPLRYILPMTPPMDFGVCLPPIFGDVKPSLLVEFFELSKILGAQHFYVYNYSSSSAVHDVLDYYQKQNEVSILKWSLPIVDGLTWYKGQVLAINDCMYRVMGKVQTLAVNDLDEFIIPRDGFTWYDLLDNIYTPGSSGYCFEMSFFTPDLKSYKKQNLLSQTLIERSNDTCKARRKCFVHPERVYEKGIHHISKQFAKEYISVPVNNSFALVHHYRRCRKSGKFQCGNVTLDDSALKYKEQLERNFQSTLFKIGENMKAIILDTA